MFFSRTKSPGQGHWQQALRLEDPLRKDYNLQEAINHFQEAIREDPNNYRFHFDLGRTYLNTPNLAAIRGANIPFKIEEAVPLAIDEFKKAIKLNPGFDASYLNLTHCYVIQGNKDEALAAYMEHLKVTKQKPDKAEDRIQNMEYAVQKRTKKEGDPAQAEAHLQQVMRYRMDGKYGKAAKELAKALAIAPDVPWLYKKLYKLGK